MMASQGYEIIIHDLDIMGSNPGRVELEVQCISAYIVFEPKPTIYTCHLWKIALYEKDNHVF